MKKYFDHNIIRESPLFREIKEHEAEALLKCLSPRRSHYKKGEYIFHMGEKISSFGLVLSGLVHVIKEDYWGNRALITDVGPGDLLGEAFSCADNTALTVSAVAAENTEIMVLDVDRIMSTCSNSCNFHNRLIRNLVTILAEKNFHLTTKITHMSQRRMREKLLSYLSEQSANKGSSNFDIPFNRQELADYLSVDRSAMSAELSRLQNEGILTYQRNHFTLLREDN